MLLRMKQYHKNITEAVICIGNSKAGQIDSSEVVLKTVTSAGRARRSATKNRSVRSVREDVEALANAAMPSAVGVNITSHPEAFHMSSCPGETQRHDDA